MFVSILKIVIISLIVIFLGHQLILYIKTKYVDSSVASTMLQDSKKMYEDIAGSLKSASKKDSTNLKKKSTKQVKIHEENNSTVYIPSENIKGVTPLKDIEETSCNDMQSELANYMNTLSQ